MLTRSLFNFRSHLRFFSAPPTQSQVTPSTGSEVLNVNKNTTDKNGTVLRSGALAIKKGMMSYWDSWGKRHPVTILHVIYSCHVIHFLI